MYRTATVLFAVCIGLGFSSLAQAAEEISLFNGKDFSGWTYYLRDENLKMEDVWSVKDGVLRCEGKPAGYLRTEKKYTNYVLKLQWRWPKDSKPGNSGVLCRISGPDKVWPRCFEPQLQHRQAGRLFFIGGFRGGKRPPGSETKISNECNEKPQGEWNQYEIIVSGGDLTLKVNGVIRNMVTGVEETAGTIGLQSEGAPIEFRNIRLIPLD